MKRMKCDVLVVGAGPAGSSAAWSSAQEGLDVVVLDKKEVPTKDACAETLSKAFLKYMPFKIPDRFLKWELKGLQFYYKDFHIIRDEGIWWKSYPLDRKELDPFILYLAIDEGANYLPQTKFVNLKYDQDFIVNEVVARDLKNKELIKIKPKVLIAADGVQSEVLRSIGKLRKQKASIGYIKSFEFQDLSLDNHHYGHVFFGKFADGAYGYIFPKSETSANIGIATLSYQYLNVRFKKFLEKIKDQIKGSRMVVDRSGKAPIKNPSEKVSYGNILFTGDAANQNIKPFVEGIIPGIICGSFAGKSAAYCLSKIEDLGRVYEEMIKKELGELFLESDEIEKALVTAYESKRKERFLLELGLFSYLLDYKDLKELEGLEGKKAELFLIEKLNP
jgi:digeranylgeranylglycerophospholipid reductase